MVSLLARVNTRNYILAWKEFFFKADLLEVAVSVVVFLFGKENHIDKNSDGNDEDWWKAKESDGPGERERNQKKEKVRHVLYCKPEHL